MNKVQEATSDSLRRVQQFLDDRAKVVGAVNTTVARRQLDAAADGVEEARKRQGVLNRKLRGEASRQRALERELRTYHVVPIAKYARASVSTNPG